jgi:hypothetical protein
MQKLRLHLNVSELEAEYGCFDTTVSVGDLSVQVSLTDIPVDRSGELDALHKEFTGICETNIRLHEEITRLKTNQSVTGGILEGVCAVLRYTQIPVEQKLTVVRPLLSHYRTIDHKIPVIKAIRSLTDLGLKEAKDVADQFFATDVLFVPEPDPMAFG